MFFFPARRSPTLIQSAQEMAWPAATAHRSPAALQNVPYQATPFTMAPANLQHKALASPCPVFGYHKLTAKRCQSQLVGRRIVFSIGLRIACAWIGIFAPASVFAQPLAVQYYLQGTEAREAGEYDRYVDFMQRALNEVPGHSILLRHIAQGYALAGRTGDAVAALSRVADTGAFFDLSAYDEFAHLTGDGGFQDVENRFEKNLEPLGQARTAFSIGDPVLVPEGIAYDPHDDVFFITSIHQRKIIAARRDGSHSDFFGGDDAFFGGLGLKVDTARRHLWAVSAAFDGMRGYGEALEGHSSLFCFSLATGEPLRRVVLRGGDTPHSLNDLALDASGRVYVTDAGSGALYVLDPGADTLSTLVDAGTLRGPNGVALDETRRALYVSQYGLDVVRVDIDTKAVDSLHPPPDVATYGVDGLYMHRGHLIAIQNHPSLDRIVRFLLSDDGRRVTGVQVLARRLPVFDEPTTGTIANDHLYFIANSQIERFVESSDRAPDAFDAVKILDIEL